VARGALSPSERRARYVSPQAPHRNPSNHKFVRGPQCGREERGIEVGERKLGLIKAPDQKEAADFETARVRGVHAVTMRFKRRACCVERFRRPAQIARGKRDLCLGDNTPRTGHRFFRTESARSASHESLRSNEIAELGHRNTSKRECRRVIAQGDPLQCAERIARCECPGSGCD